MESNSDYWPRRKLDLRTIAALAFDCERPACFSVAGEWCQTPKVEYARQLHQERFQKLEAFLAGKELD